MANDTSSNLSRRCLIGRAAAVAVSLAAGRMTEARKTEVPGEEIFARPTLLDIQLLVSARDEASLRKEPRDWVETTAIIDGRAIQQVAVHLKGTTSFMPLGKKPSFTLSFNKNAAGRRLFGLRKIHLNNSVQSPSYLMEDLCTELFHKAGVPCPRAAWATVRLNDTKLGLYVLKEGFTSEFLAMNFPKPGGNFYDGGLHQDVWHALKRDSGDGPGDHSDLKALYAATQTPDPAAKWGQLQKLLDVGRFVSMMAMENLTCHIDGYSLMQNNFRIYFEPPAGRAVFIAHGLDRMFEKPEDPLEPRWRGVVSTAILSVSEGRKLYRARLAELAEKVFQPEWMAERMDTAIRLLKPAEPLVEPEGAAARARVMARVAFVRKQLPEVLGKGV